MIPKKMLVICFENVYFWVELKVYKLETIQSVNRISKAGGCQNDTATK